MDFSSYSARLPDLIKGAVAGAVVVMIVGFQWGGWTLGSTTAQQVREAEPTGAVHVLAPICADKFQRSADAGANLAALMKASTWERDDIIEKAGWTTFRGSQPDREVAEACANLLSQAK